MTGKIEARLAELGIEIPDAPAPAANYVPFVVSGSLVFVAGQVPVEDGEIKFTGQPEVVNGASDLMAEVFGDAGKHARFAVGAPSLPRGVAVEVDGVFELA